MERAATGDAAGEMAAFVAATATDPATLSRVIAALRDQLGGRPAPDLLTAHGPVSQSSGTLPAVPEFTGSGALAHSLPRRHPQWGAGS